MYKELSNSKRLHRGAHSEASQKKSSQRRFAIFAIGGLVVLCVLAWIDGGEEPLRMIAEPIDFPEKGRGS
jgi:hypothetical protein